jgi:4-amino-4-deoxy-L-arabinose transferase-like glycosyltransferase
MISSGPVTQENGQGADTASEVRTRLLRMVLVALLLRLIVIGFLYPARLNPDRDHWRFAGEAGRIARSVVEGRGFSSPFFADTGPTAILTPVYVYLLAVCFKVFGVYSKASAIAMLSLNALFSALTCLPVYFIAKKSYGDRVAARAGWVWAFFPFAIYFAADFIWPTVLTTFLLSLLFLIALHLESSSRPLPWIGFGLLYGLAALTEPIVVAVLPALGIWACYRLHHRRQRWLLPATLGAVAFFAVVIPWSVRNYRVFHQPILFRDNFGLELFVGNNGTTWHWASPRLHPSAGGDEWRELQRLGELPYMMRKQQQAVIFIKSHVAWFVAMTLRRALYFWINFWSFDRRYLAEEPLDPLNIAFSTTLTVLAFVGLGRAFRDGLSIAVPALLVFLFFPLTYYVTHLQDYYRRPIDPLFVVLAVDAITSRQKFHNAYMNGRSIN